MKRTHILLLATLLAVSLLVSAFPAMAADWSVCYVSTANHKGLYLREDMSKDSAIILSMPYRAQLSVIEFMDSDTWAYVNYNGTRGYCMTRYLSLTRPAADSGGSGKSGGGSSGGSSENAGLGTMFDPFVASNYYAYVRPSTPSGFVNLRWAPTKSAKIRATYAGDQELRVIADSGTWCQVLDEAGLVCGYMMKSFLQVGGDGSTVGGGAGG